MDRSELFASLAQAGPDAEDIVYVERCGAAYSWHRVHAGDRLPSSATGADVWMYFSGAWPRDDPDRFAAFCTDLVAEMESMAGGDRCRWPLAEPYPLDAASVGTPGARGLGPDAGRLSH